MTQDTYRKTLTAARKDLEKLYQEREEIERKIARLRQTIISLGAITRESPDRELQKKWFREKETLTEAVLNVIMASQEPLHPQGILETLKDLGYPINPTNPAASIWSVVRRLEQKKWGKQPYMRWYSQNLEGKGRSRIGIWWGDHKPKGAWKRYEWPRDEHRRALERGDE